MKFIHLPALIIFLLTSCSTEKYTPMLITTVFRNSTTRDLDWVTLGGNGSNELSVGILAATFDKSLAEVDWSRVPNQTTLEFLDDQTRQKYSVPLAMEATNAKVKTGKFQKVIVRILTTSKAEVLLE
jgi:hypothetical protein